MTDSIRTIEDALAKLYEMYTNGAIGREQYLTGEANLIGDLERVQAEEQADPTFPAPEPDPTDEAGPSRSFPTYTPCDLGLTTLLARLEERVSEASRDVATGRMTGAEFAALVDFLAEQGAALRAKLDPTPTPDGWDAIEAGGEVNPASDLSRPEPSRSFPTLGEALKAERANETDRRNGLVDSPTYLGRRVAIRSGMVALLPAASFTASLVGMVA